MLSEDGGKQAKSDETSAAKAAAMEELAELMKPKLPHDFIAARLDETWPVFREKHRDDKIESVKTKEVNMQGKFDYHRVVFTFASGESLSAVVRSPMVPNWAMLPSRVTDAVLGKTFSKEKIEAGNKAQRQIYEVEARFYQRFAGDAISGFPLLKVYSTHVAANAQGPQNVGQTEQQIPPAMLLIMEDFTQVAREFRWAWDGEEALRNITRSLASLHLMCLNSTDWRDGMCDYVDRRRNPVGFDCADPQEAVNILTEKEKERFEEPLRRLRKAISWDFYTFATKDYPQKIGLPEVIVHGNLEPSSVLVFRANPPKPYAFLDFQSVTVGCPMIDLAHILHASTNADNRRAVEAEMLALYYGELTRGVHESGRERRDADFTLSHEELTVAYRLCKAGYALIELMRIYSHITHNTLPRMMAARGVAANSARVEHLEGMRDGLIARLAESIETLQSHAPEWLDD